MAPQAKRSRSAAQAVPHIPRTVTTLTGPPVARGSPVAWYCRRGYKYPQVVRDDVGLGRARQHGHHGDPLTVVKAYLLVVGQQLRMHRAAEHRIHDPALQVVSLHPAHNTVVLDTNQQPTSLKIGKGNNIARQLLWSQRVPFKFDARVFTLLDQS